MTQGGAGRNSVLVVLAGPRAATAAGLTLATVQKTLGPVEVPAAPLAVNAPRDSLVLIVPK